MNCYSTFCFAINFLQVTVNDLNTGESKEKQSKKEKKNLIYWQKNYTDHMTRVLESADPWNAGVTPSRRTGDVRHLAIAADRLP